MSTIMEKAARKRKTQSTGGPPKDVEPSELFKKLSARVQPHEIVDFNVGGEQLKIAIKVLTYEEQESCKIMAKAELEAKYKNAEIPDGVLQDNTCIQLLFRAVKDSEPTQLPDGKLVYNFAFTSANQIKQLLTADEVVELFNLYQLVQEKFGPRDYLLWVNDNYEDWIGTLAEGGEYYPLAQLPLPILAETIVAMARDIHPILISQQMNSESTGNSLLTKLQTTQGSSSSTEPASELPKKQQKSKAEIIKEVLEEKTALISKEDAVEKAKKIRKPNKK